MTDELTGRWQLDSAGGPSPFLEVWEGLGSGGFAGNRPPSLGEVQAASFT